MGRTVGLNAKRSNANRNAKRSNAKRSNAKRSNAKRSNANRNAKRSNANRNAKRSNAKRRIAKRSIAKRRIAKRYRRSIRKNKRYIGGVMGADIEIMLQYIEKCLFPEEIMTDEERQIFHDAAHELRKSLPDGSIPADGSRPTDKGFILNYIVENTSEYLHMYNSLLYHYTFPVVEDKNLKGLMRLLIKNAIITDKNHVRQVELNQQYATDAPGFKTKILSLSELEPHAINAVLDYITFASKRVIDMANDDPSNSILDTGENKEFRSQTQGTTTNQLNAERESQ